MGYKYVCNELYEYLISDDIKKDILFLTDDQFRDESIDLSDTESVYVFEQDGTFTMLMNGEELGSGTYTMEGDTVTIDLDGAKTELTLDGDTLRMDTETPDGRAVMLYQRAKQ